MLSILNLLGTCLQNWKGNKLQLEQFKQKTKQSRDTQHPCLSHGADEEQKTKQNKPFHRTGIGELKERFPVISATMT